MLREVPYMSTTVVPPGKLTAPKGSLLVATGSGVNASNTVNIDNDELRVNTSAGLFIVESTDIEPAGIPVAKGGLLFVSDGKLKYRGTGGTVTTLADA